MADVASGVITTFIAPPSVPEAVPAPLPWVEDERAACHSLGVDATAM